MQLYYVTFAIQPPPAGHWTDRLPAGGQYVEAADETEALQLITRYAHQTDDGRYATWPVEVTVRPAPDWALARFETDPLLTVNRYIRD